MVREASDVLLDLEDKIDEIISVIKNQDLLLKILSNKINSLEGVINNNTSLVLPVNNVVESAPVEKKILVGKKDTTDNSGNILVSQVIKNSNGKNISMARVEVFSIDEDGGMVLVSGKKANVSGKWTANLKPGKYKIKAFKLISDKESFNAESDVIIPEGNEFIQLDPLVG
jgi:hypothetical protein